VKTHKLLKLVAIGVLGYLVFIAFMVSQPDIDNYFSRTQFDSEKWKNWEETEFSMQLRWHMTHDLVSNHDLVGKSVSEILDLLGEPEGKSKSEFRYFLGHSGHGIDTGTLFLKIENNKVVSYQVWHG